MDTIQVFGWPLRYVVRVIIAAKIEIRSSVLLILLIKLFHHNYYDREIIIVPNSIFNRKSNKIRIRISHTFSNSVYLFIFILELHYLNV